MRPTTRVQCTVSRVDGVNFVVEFEGGYIEVVDQVEQNLANTESIHEYEEWGLVMTTANISQFTLPELIGSTSQPSGDGSESMEIDQSLQIENVGEKRKVSFLTALTVATSNKRGCSSIVSVYGPLRTWTKKFFFNAFGDFMEQSDGVIYEEGAEYLKKVFEESFQRMDISVRFEGNFQNYFYDQESDDEKIAFVRLLCEDMCNWTRHDDAKILLSAYKASRGGRWDIP